MSQCVAVPLPHQDAQILLARLCEFGHLWDPAEAYKVELEVARCTSPTTLLLQCYLSKMDNEFWDDPARQMRAQIMLQMLYKITSDRMESESQENPSSSNLVAIEGSATNDNNDTTQEHDVIESGPDKAEALTSGLERVGTDCDADDVFKALLSKEDIDIMSWRVAHMRLVEEYPKQHRDCHRTVWKIVDVLEQRDKSELHFNTIVPLMRDVYQLSGRHVFNRSNSGDKLVGLLIAQARAHPDTAVANLTEAVSIRRDVLRIGQGGSSLVSQLESALGLLFEINSDLDTLAERISLMRQLLSLETGEIRRIKHLSNLLRTLYDRTSELEALYEAQALRTECEQREPLNASCVVLDQMEAEFGKSAALQDVDMWIVQHLSLVQETPTSHATCPERLCSLATQMKALGIKREDLVMIMQEALRLTNRGVGISNQLQALSALYIFTSGTELRPDSKGRFDLIRRIHSLVHCSEYRIPNLSWLNAPSLPRKGKPQRQDSMRDRAAAFAFDAIAQVESERMPGLQWVNPMLVSHNDHAKPPDLMEDYKDHFRRTALELGPINNVPDNSPQKAHSLTIHALALLANNRPEMADDIVAMLLDAIRCWGVPFDRPIPLRHPVRQTLSGYSHALYMRHWWFGAAEDIELSVRLLRLCMVGATDEADHLPYLGALPSALEAKYRRLGEVKDIRDAFGLGGVLLERIAGNQQLHIITLRQCGKAADCLFDATGGITLLDYAASLVRQATRLASTGHPLMPVLLSLLGSILRKRFLHLLMPADLKVAEQLTGAAVRFQEGKDSIDQDLPNNRAMYAETLLVKFEHDPQEEDFNQALSLFQLNLDQGKDGEADRADTHYRLGNALRIRGRGEDIDKAIHHLRQTLLIQPDTRHSRYPIWTTGLSLALLAEFEKTRSSAAVHEAFHLSQTATSLIPDSHTARADVYAQLGEAKYKIFELQQNPEDLEGCLLAFQMAASSQSSPHPRCLKYTRRWEDIALKHNHDSLWGALDSSLAHQTKLAGIGRSVKARHEYLTKNPIPASRAAARSIRQGDLKRAVEYLEQGRSILWRQTLELRSSLESLQAVSPSLANQLGAVVEELHGNAGIQSVSEFSATYWGIQDPDRIHRYNRELAEHYESLVGQIQKLDGFEDFLRPFQFSDTAGIASDRPVVVVNLCDEGCDALVILDSGVHRVALPRANFESLMVARAKIATAAARVEYDGGDEMDSLLAPTLQLLWRSIVEPIIEFLKSQGPVPKRVFWCIAGMSELPIHAAGPYRAGEVNLPDILVSSYIPTISALIRARKAQVQSQSQPTLSRPRLLAVAHTDTPGFAPLPFALAEISAMKQLEVVTTELIDNDSNSGTVLSHLKSHSWAHLCCHGTTNAQLPLLSAFHLGRSSLTIESLMRTDLPTADFAFLGACHSAEGSAAQNESMSLASAMQVAGFRSIVATMYAIGDADGPVVARVLYEYLFRDKEGAVDSSEAAVGLNKAVRALRRAKAPMHRWVPFIHIGV
ncbi:hypothetical protein BDV93DRAFT_527607 [Ceratobasidium sp. AG-I]|nr:hypothetical protein BDV93DRAFT_527607 [Ceratobasidium sp. AG-I]